MNDSPATREARAVYTALALDLAGHLMDCAQCRSAKSRRRPAERCDDCLDLANVTQAANERVRREVAADLAPNPDQQALFDV